MARVARRSEDRAQTALLGDAARARPRALLKQSLLGATYDEQVQMVRPDGGAEAFGPLPELPEVSARAVQLRADPAAGDAAVQCRKPRRPQGVGDQEKNDLEAAVRRDNRTLFMLLAQDLNDNDPAYFVALCFYKIPKHANRPAKAAFWRDALDRYGGAAPPDEEDLPLDEQPGADEQDDLEANADEQDDPEADADQDAENDEAEPDIYRMVDGQRYLNAEAVPAAADVADVLAEPELGQPRQHIDDGDPRAIANGSNGWIQEGRTYEGEAVAIKRPYVRVFPAGVWQSMTVPEDGSSDVEALLASAFEAMDVEGSSHVVRIYATGVHTTTQTLGPNQVIVREPVQVFEMLTGGTLRGHLQERGPLLPSETIDRLRELTTVLVMLESVGLSHQDLKSDNIMLDGDGRLRVVDFGEATSRHGPGAVEDGGGLNPGGAGVAHRRDYEPDLQSGKSDVWSTGRLVLEMLAAGAAMVEMVDKFSTLTDQATIDAAVQAILDSVGADDEAEQAALGDLAELVLNMLKFDPDERYSAPELQEALAG